MTGVLEAATAQAAGASNPPCCPFIPLCVDCHTRRNRSGSGSGTGCVAARVASGPASRVAVACGSPAGPDTVASRVAVPLGPTLGFVAFVVAAAVEWPVGAFVYCFRHLKGRRIMAHPAAVVYPRVSSCLPI